jgi:soluble lytic murein transglycosylase-like protein
MPITPEMTERLAKRPYPETVRALAAKWGPVFDVDTSWIVSHCYVESSCNPLDYNPRGNAWGLMQIKPPTAEDIVRWMKATGASKNPRVREVLETSWRGQGEDLWNPELNVMLGTFYLAYIKRDFEKKFGRGDHEIVAAAYNQGPGAVRKALRSGEFIPTGEMRKYIAMIEKAKAEGHA